MTVTVINLALRWARAMAAGAAEQARLAGRYLPRRSTIGMRHFASRQRWFLMPLLLVLLLAGLLLLATGGLSYVAPFIYSIF